MSPHSSRSQTDQGSGGSLLRGAASSAAGCVVGLAVGALLWAGDAPAQTVASPVMPDDGEIVAELRDIRALLGSASLRPLAAEARPGEPMKTTREQLADSGLDVLLDEVRGLVAVLAGQISASPSMVADPTEDDAHAGLDALRAQIASPQGRTSANATWFGRTTQQVRRILGPPRWAQTQGDGYTEWMYYSDNVHERRVSVFFVDGYVVSYKRTE